MTSVVCDTCVLPDTFPGITFTAGVCNYCRANEPAKIRERKASLHAQLCKEIDQLRGRGRYDCVVAFSGGKDSSYTLLQLVRVHRLQCLAVMIDNGFVSSTAELNCRAVTQALGVDYQCYTPSFTFMRNLYVKSATDESIHTAASVKRASAMCNSCIGLINTYMIQTAVSQAIPMIAGGYLGGQVPPDAIAMKLNVNSKNLGRSAQVSRYTRALGPQAQRYFDVAARPDQTVLIANPMLGEEVTEDQIVAAISPLGWVRSKDTGLNSSNCQLNDLGIAVHHQRHGYHPYAFELSEQVRAGLMSRGEALRRVSDIPEFQRLQAQMDKLGYRPSAGAC